MLIITKIINKITNIISDSVVTDHSLDVVFSIVLILFIFWDFEPMNLVCCNEMIGQLLTLIAPEMTVHLTYLGWLGILDCVCSV